MANKMDRELALLIIETLLSDIKELSDPSAKEGEPSITINRGFPFEVIEMTMETRGGYPRYMVTLGNPYISSSDWYMIAFDEPPPFDVGDMFRSELILTPYHTDATLD